MSPIVIRVCRKAREEIFRTFQRAGDVPAGNGVGRGLAGARIFTEAMGGHSRGREIRRAAVSTMVIMLPAAPAALDPPREEIS